MKSEQRTTEQRRHAAIEQRQWRAQFQRQPAAGDEHNDPAMGGREIRHRQHLLQVRAIKPVVE